ncbi:MAG: efflux RND transporter permease subunit, partial [Chthoniobacterales bacterium]
QNGSIPSSVSLSISGAANQLDATRDSLQGNFIVAVLLSYLLLVVIFKHWGYPFIILTTVPLGLAGGIIGLWILNFVGGLLPLIGLAKIIQPFDMITMLGFLILLGTVVNNPILIVDRTMQNIKQGLPSVEAVREAVETRLRPILMSTITTICGLAPLVLIPGAGTELYRGVGAIVLFGLLFSTIISLTFLPCLLVTLSSFSRRPATNQ